MLFTISILFIIAAIMKFYGFNIIHRIKKKNTVRTENKKKYDRRISLGCGLIGTVFLMHSRFYVSDSDLLFIVLFIAIVLVVYAPIVYREGFVGRFLSKIENSDKKRKVIRGCFIADTILVIMLILWKIIKCTEYGFRLEFYFLGLDTAIAVFIGMLFIIVSLLFIISVTLYKKKVIILLTTVIALCAFCISLFICAWTIGGDYRSFYSPNFKQSIVIEKWTFLLGEDVRVYERENLFFIRRIGSLPIDVFDFQPGNYDIEWKENKVVITLFKGSLDEKICAFDLGE